MRRCRKERKPILPVNDLRVDRENRSGSHESGGRESWDGFV